jgi:hypothetical protein
MQNVMNFYFLWLNYLILDKAPQKAVYQDVETTHQDHTVAVCTLSYLSYYCLPLTGVHAVGISTGTLLKR